MNNQRPTGKVRIIGATPRDLPFTDQLPWYSNQLRYPLREYRVYLDNPSEFQLVDPTIAGLGPGGYAAITRCDAKLMNPSC